MYKIYTKFLGMRLWHIPKLFFIMRLITIILLTTMVHASALTVAQTISISKTNATLVEVFSDVSKQSDYDFFYSSKQLTEAKKVTINIKNGTIDEVLTQCFKEQPFGYAIKNKIITIKKKEPAPAQKKANRFSAITVTGSVIDTLGKPLAGATVKLLDEPSSTRTNEQGNFTITSEKGAGILVVSYLGYKTRQIAFSETNKGPFTLTLTEEESGLKEVEVVSTGYQNIPKERATGSFVLINNALLNRRVGSNILDRLDGVTSGLIFNRNPQGPYVSDISIRGRSTIFANSSPLIILDNFPYPGDLSTINPNDIETITVLKDAAAASIWGVKAGNGVIVITTKKGNKNSPPTVNLNTNFSIGERPDLFYKPQLNSAQFIDIEQFLFNKGAYNSAINAGYSAISPAVEVLLSRRNRTISDLDSAMMMGLLKANDVRNDINRYLTRPQFNQQYHIDINGGSTQQQYFISAGYDQNNENATSNSNNRTTLNARNTYSFLKNKLEWTSSLQFSNTRDQNNSNAYKPLYPYDVLADSDGNPMPTTKNLRSLYTDTTGNGKLLDWHYFPINENNANAVTQSVDYRIGTDVSYKIFKQLKIAAYYLFQKGISDNQTQNGSDSYYTRDLINSYSQLNRTTGAVTYPIPFGDILDKTNSSYKLNTGRIQLNLDQSFGEYHRLTALAGFEVSENKTASDSFRLYGYDPSTAVNSNQTINYTLDYPLFYGNGSGRIPNRSTGSGTTDRNRSYFANAAYSFKEMLIVSASTRWDESNIFGVKTNQKGVPLWSTGLSWNIGNASFYQSNLLPELRLRATYGYNGNTDKSTTAYLTSSAGSFNPYNDPFLRVVNPPNPSLRWEKVRVINFGADFGFKNKVISGSIEYYEKKSTDLIANSPVAPQTGFDQFKGNAADMLTKGIDISLNSSLINRQFKWNTGLLFNIVRDKVIDYKVKQGSNLNIVTGNYNNPLEGYSYFSIFSYPYAGLDSLGNPRGYLNGVMSNNYSAIVNSSDRSNLKYSGSGTPTFFGSFLNNFSYRNLELSINLIYKLGYYFRRSSLDYGTLFSGSYLQPDYENRWQQRGDEQRTNVPSMIYPSNTNRNNLYRNADILVEKADHIRVQDIRISYLWNHAFNRIRRLQFYLYVNNLGIIWRANKYGLDPDYSTSFPATKIASFGLKANL